MVVSTAADLTAVAMSRLASVVVISSGAFDAGMDFVPTRPGASTAFFKVAARTVPCPAPCSAPQPRTKHRRAAGTFPGASRISDDASVSSASPSHGERPRPYRPTRLARRRLSGGDRGRFLREPSRHESFRAVRVAIAQPPSSSCEMSARARTETPVLASRRRSLTSPALSAKVRRSNRRHGQRTNQSFHRVHLGTAG